MILWASKALAWSGCAVCFAAALAWMVLTLLVVWTFLVVVAGAAVVIGIVGAVGGRR